MRDCSDQSVQRGKKKKEIRGIVVFCDSKRTAPTK